ncbi:MAG: preprotein translocase subunit SecG [Enhygromyxa sp.]
MQTFITIIYVIVAFMMVLAILLQAGKGGGLGSALGGGASQGVFGGGGGADFMAKLTQGFAATFMICAMYLAYASAHAGSEFLEGQDAGASDILDADAPIDFERIGINPQRLPTAEEGKAMQAKAVALVPAQSEADDLPPPAEPVPPNADDADGDDADNDDRGDSPDGDRGESLHGGEESLQDSPASLDGSDTESPEPADDEDAAE